MVSALTRVLFWCLFPELLCNTKIALEWTHKQFVTRVQTLCYFLHDITNPSMTLKTIFTCHPHVSLTRITFCLCRHNRLLMTLQWPDNCDSSTWNDMFVFYLMSYVTWAVSTNGRKPYMVFSWMKYWTSHFDLMMWYSHHIGGLM